MNGSAGYLSSDALIELTIIDVNDETPTVNTMNTGSVSCVESKLGYYRVMPSEPVEGVIFGRPVEG